MEEIYKMMREKLMKCYDTRGEIHFTFHEFGRLYAIVCYMRQVADIFNGIDATEKRRVRDEADG